MPDWVRLVCCPSKSDPIECSNHLDVMDNNTDNKIQERSLMDYFTPISVNLRIV